MEFGGQRFHLLARLPESAGAVDFLRRQAQLFFHRHLRGDTAACFVFTESARAESLELLLRRAPYNHDAVEMFVDTRFDEQRGFDKRGVARAVALPFIELAEDQFRDARMHDGVEPIKLRAILENQRGQLGAVTRPWSSVIVRPNSRRTSS